MTIRYNMATQYGVFSAGDTIQAAWGNDINDSLDDKVSKSRFNAFSGNFSLTRYDNVTEETTDFYTKTAGGGVSYIYENGSNAIAYMHMQNGI